MPRPRAFDDDSVVLAAREVFWERGYTNTSMTQLLDATGLSRSSLYETYGSKRGLFDRAVRSYMAEMLVPMLEPLELPGAGARELEAYFRALAGLIRSAPAQSVNRGCLMLNTTIELDEVPDGVTDLAAGYCVRVRTAVRAALASVGSVDDLDARADMLLASQLGLLAAARLDGRTAATMADTVAADIASW